MHTLAIHARKHTDSSPPPPPHARATPMGVLHGCVATHRLRGPPKGLSRTRTWAPCASRRSPPTERRVRRPAHRCQTKTKSRCRRHQQGRSAVGPGCCHQTLPLQQRNPAQCRCSSGERKCVPRHRSFLHQAAPAPRTHNQPPTTSHDNTLTHKGEVQHNTQLHPCHIRDTA